MVATIFVRRSTNGDCRPAAALPPGRAFQGPPPGPCPGAPTGGYARVDGAALGLRHVLAAGRARADPCPRRRDTDPRGRSAAVRRAAGARLRPASARAPISPADHRGPNPVLESF